MTLQEEYEETRRLKDKTQAFINDVITRTDLFAEPPVFANPLYEFIDQLEEKLRVIEEILDRSD